MKSFLIRLFVMTAAIGLAGAILPGIVVSDLGGAVIAALVLGILNAVVRPVLFLLTLPLNLLTLGLFTFIINALVLSMADWLVDGIQIGGFFWALVGSIFISIISWILNLMIGEEAEET